MKIQYRVPGTFTVTAANTDVDLLLIRPAAEKKCRLVGWIISQSSEVGDAQEENLRVTVRHMTATLTVTGGTSVTPVPDHPGGDAAASMTATVYHATVTTTNGTSTIMEELGWNVRNAPWERWIPEEQRPEAITGEGVIVRLESTVADDIVFEVTFFVEEEK